MPNRREIQLYEQIMKEINDRIPTVYAERTYHLLLQNGVRRSLSQIRNARLGRRKDLYIARALRMVAQEHEGVPRWERMLSMNFDPINN